MKSRLAGGAAFLWLMGIVLATRPFMDFETRPGDDAVVPSKWPNQSKLHPVPGQPTLIMMAHPKCPCTDASLDELADLVRNAGTPILGFVLFDRPSGLPSSWTRTPLWEKARGIPGMTPVEDPEATEARLFGATTSGHVFLYDAQGTLQFSGGITSSRGARGESAGKTSLLSHVTRGSGDLTRTPVFGCPLRERQER
jgi:hypothetical protein